MAYSCLKAPLFVRFTRKIKAKTVAYSKAISDLCDIGLDPAYFPFLIFFFFGVSIYYLVLNTSYMSPLVLGIWQDINE